MKRRRRYWNEHIKQIRQRIALKHHRRKVRWRIIKKNERRRKCDENANRNRFIRKNIRHVYELRRFKHFTRRNAPKDFSIIGNHEKVISFCNDLRNDYRKHHRVFVNLEKVTSVTNESLSLLVSNMMLFQQSNIDFNGNFPIDEKSRLIVVKSGFLETLYKKKSSINRVNSTIYTHSSKRSNSELIEALIDSSSKFLWGQSCDCDGVYNALIELMLNTFEHGNEIEGKQKWWVTVTKDEDNQRVTFSFLDYGRGIIKTLRDVQHKHHSGIVEKILYRIGNITNSSAVLLKEVVEGALVISEKEDSQYGNGLHSIYSDMLDHLLDNVIIITNNVYADLKNNIYQMMNVSFHGTFISFEINKDTVHGNTCSNSIYSNA